MVWKKASLSLPSFGRFTHEDMPPEIKQDFDEARSILERSPRGAAALLRLCVQKLCMQLAPSGKNLNDAIGKLVEKGLPIAVKEALDSVRVIGNESVHPGTLDIRDDPDTALTLFKLVNFIVEQMISLPLKIAAIHEKLPRPQREAIDRRDRKAKSSQT